MSLINLKALFVPTSTFLGLTTTTATEAIERGANTSPTKSKKPGVSMKFILTFYYIKSYSFLKKLQKLIY